VKVKIVEVGARDGLQNEARNLSVRQRLSLVKGLVKAGLRHVEVGAFVSPKWVPQMAGTDRLIEAMKKDPALKKTFKTHSYSVLVPNLKGMELALPTGVKQVAVFGACSEAFSQRNINCSIKESFVRFQEVIGVAKRNKIKVRGYLSTAFGCPYEGRVSEARVLNNIERMLEMGVFEVSIGDTIGVATPKQVSRLCQKIDSRFGVKKIAMHFHDTRGTALANVLASLDQGIRIFDSSVGGLGGCPYAQGAAGNLATEDLVYMLDGMSIQTGVDLSALIQIYRTMSKRVDRVLPSHVGAAGLPLPNTLK
jgi:hydroxymethylglutaryl-CoA lyase